MSVYYGTRETMLTFLVNALLAVGFHRVDRQKSENYSNDVYPSAYVNDVGESRVYALEDVARVAWTVAIIAYDYSETGDLGTKVNALITLVSNKLKLDRTLGGQSYGLKIVNITTDEGTQFPHCVAGFQLEIFFLET